MPPRPLRPDQLEIVRDGERVTVTLTPRSQRHRGLEPASRSGLSPDAIVGIIFATTALICLLLFGYAISMRSGQPAPRPRTPLGFADFVVLLMFGGFLVLPLLGAVLRRPQRRVAIDFASGTLSRESSVRGLPPRQRPLEAVGRICCEWSPYAAVEPTGTLRVELLASTADGPWRLHRGRVDVCDLTRLRALCATVNSRLADASGLAAVRLGTQTLDRAGDVPRTLGLIALASVAAVGAYAGWTLADASFAGTLQTLFLLAVGVAVPVAAFVRVARRAPISETLALDRDARTITLRSLTLTGVRTRTVPLADRVPEGEWSGTEVLRLLHPRRRLETRLQTSNAQYRIDRFREESGQPSICDCDPQAEQAAEFLAVRDSPFDSLLERAAAIGRGEIDPNADTPG